MHCCHTMVDAHKRMTSHVRVRSVLDESRRAVKHVRTRARARFLRTHLPPLTASHTAQSIRVTARARRQPRGCQCFLGVKDLMGKKHLRSFRKIFNMLHYIPFPIIYSKSTFVIVNNFQKIIV